MDRLNEENFAELLTAFSDGELDATQTERVLEHLRQHPDALAALEQEQRLRIAARRVVLQGTPTAPEALKAIIAEMPIPAPPMPIGDYSNRGRRNVAVFGACAASILIGTAIGYVARPEPASPVMHVSGPIAGPVSATTVATVTRMHVDCSRMLAMHTAGYPKAMEGLAQIVKQELDTNKPYPDLSSVGYAYVGAGPCAHPMDGTIHLLYRSTRPGVTDTLSVFVQPFTGQLHIDAGKAYRIGAENAPHPALVWRTADAIYFVVGDDQGVVDKACETIGLAKL